MESRERKDYKLTMIDVPNEQNKVKQKPDEDKDRTCTDDQEGRGYYYDDAHGYQEYDPEAEDDEFDD